MLHSVAIQGGRVAGWQGAVFQLWLPEVGSQCIAVRVIVILFVCLSYQHPATAFAFWCIMCFQQWWQAVLRHLQKSSNYPVSGCNDGVNRPMTVPDSKNFLVACNFLFFCLQYCLVFPGNATAMPLCFLMWQCWGGPGWLLLYFLLFNMQSLIFPTLMIFFLGNWCHDEGKPHISIHDMCVNGICQMALATTTR